MPTVSIITPSYNQGTFIKSTIDSVLTQDYADIEYIVIDGGSTDNTVEILRGYDDPRMTWISERDKGQSDALNKGLERATGDLITFINSDDLLMPGALRFAVEYFAQHPDADVLYGDGEYIDATGKHLAPFRSARFDLSLTLIGGQNLAQPGTFWRRRVSDAVGLFDTSMHYRFDFDYWIRIALAGYTLHYVGGNRAAYRLHETSKTVNQIDRFLGDWEKIVQKVFARPDLPTQLRALEADAFKYVEWHQAKAMWLKGQRVEARPLLRPFLTAPRSGRRLLALAMLLDSYIHTPSTRCLAFAFKLATGKDILVN